MPGMNKAQKKAALIKLYGNLMSDLLHMIKSDTRCPDDIRTRCATLQEKWDAVSPHVPMNPISVIEAEKRLLK